MAKPVTVDAKIHELRRRLDELAPVVVAISGGVDSSVLLVEAVEAVGRRASAAVAVSPALAREDLVAARDLCRSLHVDLLEVATDELDDPNYALNAGDRCFFCRMEQYGALLRATAHIDGRTLVDGTHADDRVDDRPGWRANRRLGVGSPLRDAGLLKADVRAWARRRGLAVWDKPEAACLASRILVGRRVTARELDRVAAGERALRGLGLRVLRVRSEGRHARVEVGAPELPRLFERRDEVVAALRRVGYDTVALDPAGYRRRKVSDDAEGKIRGERAPGRPDSGEGVG